MKLDDRLAAAADLVLPGRPAADIGTDHSYLPVYLVQNDICPFVIASDKAKIPYENALRAVEKLALESRIEVRLGEGVGVLKSGEVATIIIAGIGGCLMRDILDAYPKILAHAERLVLQPQRNADILRHWLAANNWQIIEETIAFDRGLFYVVMAAEHGRMELTEDEAVFGPCILKKPPQLLSSYLEQKKARLDSLTARLREYSGAEVEKRIRQLQYRSQKIREILTALACRERAKD